MVRKQQGGQWKRGSTENEIRKVGRGQIKQSYVFQTAVMKQIGESLLASFNVTEKSRLRQKIEYEGFPLVCMCVCVHTCTGRHAGSPGKTAFLLWVMITKCGTLKQNL